MTMANEMTQLASNVAASKSQRVKTVTAIKPALRRQLNANRSARHAAMNRLMTSIKKDLDGIFSETAVIRGRSVDMMQTLASRRKDNAKALRAELEGYISGLETSVATLLRDYGRARDEIGAREMAARETFLKDLHARVQKLLQNAEKSIADLAADRAKAGNAWRERVGAKGKPRREMDEKAVTPEPAPVEAAAPEPVAESKEVATAATTEPAVAETAAPKPVAESRGKAPGAAAQISPEKKGS